MIVRNGGPVTSSKEVTLFAFDDYSIPFHRGLKLDLVRHLRRIGTTRIVLECGPQGAPDSERLTYYGTVLGVGQELWMYYLGQGDEPEWRQRVCLALSTDGYNWRRPSLGLVEYNGSKDNNLIQLLGVEHHVTACVILHEPDDPDPSRRFKMAFESTKYQAHLAVAFSEDGLRWTEFEGNPVGPAFEMSGAARVGDCYYLAGQNWQQYGYFRQMNVHASYDFCRWTQSSCIGFRRSSVPPRATLAYGNDGEQIHLGAGLWNRGSVVIGFYGQWHGSFLDDRRLVSMDLGMVISHDGLHYREPVPDFRIVSAAEDGWTLPPQGTTALHMPAIVQGQGFEDIGDETLFWYSSWPEHDSTGIRVAVWERDRLGFLQPFWGPGRDSHLISAPIALENENAEIYVNVDGVGEHASIRAALLDREFQEAPGFGIDECLSVRDSGFRQKLRWRKAEVVPAEIGEVRVRINFEGVRPEDIKLYAVYAAQAGDKA
ncbi:MAG: hypothetical protein IT209_11455 [Armatimonadetes bacterium]|nr:hypothetical protein [Armatimonadota bacterium]